MTSALSANALETFVGKRGLQKDDFIACNKAIPATHYKSYEAQRQSQLLSLKHPSSMSG